MKVYLVWDGYEDIAGVFLNQENAEKYLEEERKARPQRYADFNLTEEVVLDGPTP